MTMKPQDHQAKKPRVKDVDGGKRVTFPDLIAKDADGKALLHDGKPTELSVTVLSESLDDFELLDDLRAVDVDQNASRLPALLRRLVGNDYSTVMNALRNDGGRVQIGPAAQFIRDLFGALDPNS